jgi:hypothetical protein
VTIGAPAFRVWIITSAKTADAGISVLVRREVMSSKNSKNQLDKYKI